MKMATVYVFAEENSGYYKHLYPPFGSSFLFGFQSQKVLWEISYSLSCLYEGTHTVHEPGHMCTEPI